MADLNIRSDEIDAPCDLPAPPTIAQHVAAALVDMRRGLLNWRMWVLLGMNDIRQRYRRSRLGQFWITLAMAVQIISLGILYSFLFKQPLAKYLPYLGTSFVVWGLISAIVLESCGVFISAEGYIRQVPMPKSVLVHRMLFRNGVIFLHNLVLLPPLFLIYDVPVGWVTLLVFPALFVLILNGIWAALLLGTICARFRDMPQIIANIVQIVFYLTPVMWRPSQLPVQLNAFTNYNPFQAFLDIVRAPLLGEVPPALSWMVAGGITVAGFIVAMLFFSRFRARIVYWL